MSSGVSEDNTTRDLAPRASTATLTLPPGWDDSATAPSSAVPIDTPSAKRITLGAVLRFRWTILVTWVALSVLGVGLVWAAFVPEYRATAIIEVSPVIPQLLAGKSDMVPLYESYRGSQADYIRNPVVLNGMLDDARIRQTNWYRDVPTSPLERWMAKAGMRTPGAPMDRISQELLVTVPPGKQLINLAMTARTPGEAKLILDRVLSEYVRFVNERSSASDNEVMAKLRKEIGDREVELRTIEGTASQLRQQLGTASPDELVRQRALDLLTLESTVASLRTEIEVARRTLDALNETAASQPTEEVAVEEETPELRYQRDARWQELRDRVKLAKRDVQRREARFGPGDQQLVQLREFQEEAEKELADWQRQLDQLPEDETVAGGPAKELPQSPEALRRSLSQMTIRLEELTRQLQEERERSQSVFSDAERLAQKNEERLKADELRRQLERRLEELRMNRELAGQVRTYPALEPSAPSDDKRLKYSIAAVFGALVAGLGLALLRVRFSPTLDDALEASLPLQQTLLGGFPLAPTLKDASELETGVHWEAVRLVRTALLNRLGGATSVVVHLSSASTGAGKSTMAMLLARSLAHAGKRVLLVDADMRRASLSNRILAGPTPGLSDLLKNAAMEPLAVQRSSTSGLDVLSAGSSFEPHDAELLADGAFSGLIAGWRKRYDIVLLDGPPMIGPADAAILASKADGTIMMIRQRHCDRQALVEALAVLGAAGGRLLGTIFVGSTSGRGYSYKGYGYGYGYGYGGPRNAPSADARNGAPPGDGGGA